MIHLLDGTAFNGWPCPQPWLLAIANRLYMLCCRCTCLPRGRPSFHPFPSLNSVRRQRDGDYKNGIDLVMSAMSWTYKNRFCFEFGVCFSVLAMLGKVCV